MGLANKKRIGRNMARDKTSAVDFIMRNFSGSQEAAGGTSGVNFLKN